VEIKKLFKVFQLILIFSLLVFCVFVETVLMIGYNLANKNNILFICQVTLARRQRSDLCNLRV